VRTAIRLADEEGFDAVTMRRVAAELGFGTMSLYWYVQNRDELLDLMFDELIAEQLLPEPLPSGWREGLAAIAHANRGLHLRHPWLSSHMGMRPSVGPNLLRHLEQSLAVTTELVPYLGLRTAAIRTVDEYVIGYVLATNVGPSEQATVEDWVADMIPTIRAMVDPETMPNVVAALEDDMGMWSGDHFHVGLDLVLDGIDAALARAKAG
jgi:AcrR family transcriptional regulator